MTILSALVGWAAPNLVSAFQFLDAFKVPDANWKKERRPNADYKLDASLIYRRYAHNPLKAL